MTYSRILMDLARAKQDAYKTLDGYVKPEPYFAYIQGVQDCINLLQKEEEAAAEREAFERMASNL